MYRAVIDTNVFVSGGTISAGAPSRVINHWKNQEFVIVASPQLISEYEEVLLRPSVMKYTGLNPQESHQYVQEVKNRAYITNGELILNVLTIDPDDNMVLACAQEGVATHLVTGNRKHFPFTDYNGIKILTPREFLTFLEK